MPGVDDHAWEDGHEWDGPSYSPLVLHFLGDSTVHGFVDTRSWRPFLIDRLEARGWRVTCVGSLTGSPGGDPLLAHDGHDGFTTGHYTSGQYVYAAHVAICALGANDPFVAPTPYTAAQWLANMQAIRGFRAAANPHFVAVTPYRGRPTLAPWDDPAANLLVDSYDAISPALAGPTTSVCRTLYEQITDPATQFRPGDGYHLNDTVGNPLAADLLLEHLIAHAGL